MTKFARWKKRIAATAAAVLLCQTIGLVLPSFAYAADDLNVDAKAAILMDASSGQVLYEKNADEALPPASMTKMMTEYLILQNIANGKLTMDEQVTISEYSSAISKNTELSGVPKNAGETFTVKDLLSAMAIYSDNGSAISLAERIAGSEEKFVQMMNEEAKKMGLSQGAHFINTSGLDRVDLKQWAPAGIEGETVYSARDAATIAFHSVNDHPELLDYSKIPSKNFRPTDSKPMINYNWMLEGNKTVTNVKKYAYDGLDGLKTGHTDLAGYCFTGTAQRNGTRLISVVMNAKTRDMSFTETRRMLDYGFSNFEKKTILEQGASVDELKEVKIRKGKSTTVEAVTEQPLALLVKKGSNIEVTRAAQAVDEKELVAPIKKGTVVGTLTVKANGQDHKLKLVAKEDVSKASWIRLFFRAIKNFFIDLFHSIKNLF